MKRRFFRKAASGWTAGYVTERLFGLGKRNPVGMGILVRHHQITDRWVEAQVFLEQIDKESKKLVVVGSAKAVGGFLYPDHFRYRTALICAASTALDRALNAEKE